MNTLEKVTDTNENALYAFEHNGMMITNPLFDEDGVGSVSPEYYGFEVWGTGGGCTAHGKEFLLDGKKVVMLLTDGNLSHIETDSTYSTVGLFDEEWESLGIDWEVNR